MNIVQPLTVFTERGVAIQVILEENKETGRFNVIMSYMSFPAGTTFASAEEALGAALRAIRGVIAQDDRVKRVASMPMEEFVGPKDIERLVFGNNADHV